ncbi:MAG TPA: hypothetical protein PKH50_00215 [bacterium]|jgi:hypothetical protein|nr:hypothetical protein [bacterium]
MGDLFLEVSDLLPKTDRCQVFRISLESDETLIEVLESYFILITRKDSGESSTEYSSKIRRGNDVNINIIGTAKSENLRDIIRISLQIVLDYLLKDKLALEELLESFK